MPNWTGFRTRIKIEFQDVLALCFVVPFLSLTVMVVVGVAEMEILRIYVTLISIILGGYFAQGTVREYQRGDPNSTRPLYDYPYQPPKENDRKI